MRYLSSLSVACFSIPTASRECLSGFLCLGNFSLLGPYSSIWAYESCMALLCASPSVTIGQLPDPLHPVEYLKHPNLCFVALASLTYLLYIFVSFLRWHLCAHIHDKLLVSQIPDSILSFYMHHAIFCLLCFHNWSIPYGCSHSECFIMFDWPSAECLNRTISRHAIQTYPGISQLSLSLLAPFFSDVFILKYHRSWLFCTHSCGEHLILYSLKPPMSCGSSSTHSASGVNR